MTAQARLLGGRYQVAELLGYGGMAEVHKGRDLRLGRDVAIKSLRSDLARDPTFQERFRREAQNAAALNHPAIVAVYDTGEETSSTGEKLPFIVMEFVNGQTLKEVLAAEQRLPVRRALEYIADIDAALEFSHRHGIIHRDIKPGNVMLTQTGQIKVMDFGIARALASGATTMTQTSAVIGTAQYLSPEQARGEAVDARSDVYAAGCVLFELLCGHPPFVGDSPVSVAYQHVREDPRTPSDINPEVPPDVDAIVLKALAKNPLNRYQSAQEMRADALRAVAGRPVLATPVMNEAETMAMRGAGPSGYPTNATRAIPSATMAPREPERTSSWVMAVLAGLGVLAAVALGVGLYLVNQDDKPRTPTTVAMPDLLGKTDDEATQLLTDAKLTGIVRGKEIRDDKCKQGQVARQTPDKQTKIALNQPGEYRLCAGREQATIPGQLIGAPFDNVKARLDALGFKVEQKTRNDTSGEGTVLAVDPGEGETVTKNSTVTVTVSNGSLNEMPSVLGEDVATAQARLDAQGFKSELRDGSSVEPDDTPTVEKQNIKPGTKAERGTTVILTVTKPRAAPPTQPTGSPSPSTSNPSAPGDGDPNDPGGGNGAGDGRGGLGDLFN